MDSSDEIYTLITIKPPKLERKVERYLCNVQKRDKIIKENGEFVKVLKDSFYIGRATWRLELANGEHIEDHMKRIVITTARK